MRRFLILAAVLCSLSARAAPPLVLEGDHGQLGGHLAVAVDPTHTLDVAVLAAPAATEFRDLPGSLSLGFTSATVWLRFTVLRPAAVPSQWWLEVEPPYVDDLTLFVPRADGSFEPRHAGHLNSYAAREIPYRNAVFRLDLPADQPQTFYVRIESVHSMFASLELRQPQAFVRAATRAYLGWGIFVGTALALILSSIWFWRVTRDLEYFLLAAFAFSVVTVMLSAGGFTQQWLLPALPAWHDPLLGIAMSVAMGAAAHFINRFTQLARHLPRVERTFTRVTWAMALYGCGGFALGRFSQTMPTIQISILAVSVLNTALTAWLVWRRQPQAATMLVAMLTFWMVIPLRMLQTLGSIPREFGSDAMLNLSVLLYLVVMNFAGHQRYLRLRRENEAAQAQALATARDTAHTLEDKVAERTQALSSALTQVEKARAREQEVNREQRQFVATVSHELRTPLAVIDATVQNLLLLNAANLDASARARLDKIQLAADRLATIVDEGLTPARLCVLDDAPKLMNASLHDLLADAALKTYMSYADHHIDVECAPDIVAYCDPELLRLVLRTLADNAAKYTPPGTHVALRARVDDNGIDIEIADDGPGIAADELPHVFEKYFRGRGAASQPGTGLGLPLARYAVEAMGGTIAVTAAKGTTFTIRLPPTPA